MWISKMPPLQPRQAALTRVTLPTLSGRIGVGAEVAIGSG
jgi:hypothetical protein